MKIKMKKLKCRKCGHSWMPRKEEVRQCPKCKSAWWDKIQKMKGGKNGFHEFLP